MDVPSRGRSGGGFEKLVSGNGPGGTVRRDLDTIGSNRRVEVIGYVIVRNGNAAVVDTRTGSRRINRIGRKTRAGGGDGIVVDGIAIVSSRRAGAEKDYATGRAGLRALNLCVRDRVVGRIVDKQDRCAGRV